MDRLSAATHPLLSASAIRTLAQNGITSLVDLLGAEMERVSILTSLSLADVLEMRGYLLAKHAAAVYTGLQFHQIEDANSAHIRTGISSLDSILGGGVPIRYITEICGLACSGKTQLCVTITMQAIVDTDCTVLYVDTKGDLSAVAIQKYLEKNGHSYEEMAAIMGKIKVARVWNMTELLDLFIKLKCKEYNIECLRLIVIDSLPALMFQFLGYENKIGLTLLNKFVNIARYLCNEHRMSVICVNVMTRWVEQAAQDIEESDVGSLAEKGLRIEKKHRCLGRYWQHIPALVVQLDKHRPESNDGEISFSATIAKSINGKCSVSTNFYLSDVGVT